MAHAVRASAPVPMPLCDLPPVTPGPGPDSLGGRRQPPGPVQGFTSTKTRSSRREARRERLGELEVSTGTERTSVGGAEQRLMHRRLLRAPGSVQLKCGGLEQARVSLRPELEVRPESWFSSRMGAPTKCVARRMRSHRAGRDDAACGAHVRRRDRDMQNS